MLKKRSDLLQIRLEPELKIRLEALADHNSVTLSEMLRLLIHRSCENLEAYLYKKAEHERKKQERLLNSAANQVEVKNVPSAIQSNKKPLKRVKPKDLTNRHGVPTSSLLTSLLNKNV